MITAAQRPAAVLSSIVHQRCLLSLRWIWWGCTPQVITVMDAIVSGMFLIVARVLFYGTLAATLIALIAAGMIAAVIPLRAGLVQLTMVENPVENSSSPM